MRQLIDADEEKLGALILIHIVFVAAVAEAGGRAIGPRNDVLGFVVAAVQRARDIAAEIREQRRFQLGIGAAEQQRIGAGDFIRLINCLPEKRFGLAWARGAAEEAIFRFAAMEFALARERIVVVAQRANFGFAGHG